MSKEKIKLDIKSNKPLTFMTNKEKVIYAIEVMKSCCKLNGCIECPITPKICGVWDSCTTTTPENWKVPK